jgi:hypothetical protein
MNVLIICLAYSLVYCSLSSAMMHVLTLLLTTFTLIALSQAAVSVATAAPGLSAGAIVGICLVVMGALFIFVFLIQHATVKHVIKSALQYPAVVGLLVLIFALLIIIGVFVFINFGNLLYVSTNTPVLKAPAPAISATCLDRTGKCKSSCREDSDCIDDFPLDPYWLLTFSTTGRFDDAISVHGAVCRTGQCVGYVIDDYIGYSTAIGVLLWSAFHTCDQYLLQSNAAVTAGCIVTSQQVLDPAIIAPRQSHDLGESGILSAMQSRLCIYRHVCGVNNQTFMDSF